MIRLAGAELIEVPAVPYKNPNNYIKLSGRLAKKLSETLPEGAIWANQFDNVANKQAHVDTTGPEIWQQTDNLVDGFICACGSGGTLAGVTEFLKPKGVKVGLVDPMGAALFSYFTDGVLASRERLNNRRNRAGRITENLKGFIPDYAYQVEDEEALNIVFDLMENEGLCLGSSSGINIAGAKRMAKDLGKDAVVTIL